MKPLLAGLVLLAGCDWFNPKPLALTHLQEVQNEVAEVQAKVDLAIAKSDSEAIEGNQYRFDNTQKAWDRANAAKNSDEANALSKQMGEIGTDLDKSIDRAARHRCNR